MNLAFLADGDPSKGIGHLVRALSLALELSSEQEIAFFSASDSGLVRKIEAQLRPFYPEAKIQIKNSPALAGS